MGFINEKILPADYVKYGLAAIDGKYSATSSGSSSWTIDHEREIYLRHTQSFRDWRGRIIGMNFYWKGELFDFELEHLEKKVLLVGQFGITFERHLFEFRHGLRYCGRKFFRTFAMRSWRGGRTIFIQLTPLSASI